MNELAEISEELEINNQAAALVHELHGDNDFLLSGAMIQLLARRVELLLRAERLVMGTSQAHAFDAAIKRAIEGELAARAMFAALSRLLEQPAEPTIH